MSINGCSSIWMCFLLFYGVSSLNISAKQVFTDKLMCAQQKLMNNIYQNSRDKNNVKVNTTTIWSKSKEMQPNPNIVLTIIKTSNHTLVFNNMDISALQDEKLHYRISLLRYVDYDIQLVKGYEWQNRLFILVCFQNNICSLYSATPNFDVTYHQPISDFGTLTDAQFFVQNGTLFLTILSHGFDSAANQLRIYQWHHLFMDPELIRDVNWVSTANSITLFRYGEDVVFVLKCPGDTQGSSLKFPSQVWIRKPNGEMRRVQYLPTKTPISITHFTERGENFILIMEEDRDSSICRWKGDEFVCWRSVIGIMKHHKVAVSSNLKDTTFFMFTHRNILKMYLMTAAKLDQIYEVAFSGDKTEVISISSVSVFEENGITYMFALTKSKRQIYISLHKINVQILDTVAFVSEEVPCKEDSLSDSAQEALNSIFEGIRSLKYKMDFLDTLSSSVLFTNKNATIPGVVKVSEEVHVESGEIRALVHIQMDIPGLINHLYSHINPLGRHIDMTWEKLQTTSINSNRHLIFHGRVVITNEAKINSVTAKLVNNNIFEPDSFLFINKPHQRLKSLKVKKVKVNWLGVTLFIGQKRVEDFVIADSKVSVPVSVAGLESQNLRISENVTINNIKVKDLTEKMVTVEAEGDTFNKISQIGARRNPDKPGTLQLQDHTVIHNLNIDLIDGFPVNDLFVSVFVNEIRNIIHGNINFETGVRTSQMAADSFNFPMEHSIQASQPEPNIYPQVPLYRPLAPQEPLFLQYMPPVAPFIYGNGRKKRDDSEEYGRPIINVVLKIYGDLKVRKLLFHNSSLVVNSQPVPTSDLGKIFWTRNTPQEINGSVHFSRGISIGSSLKNPIVNGRNLSSYATRKSNFKSLIFENIHVVGNIVSEENDSVWLPENKYQMSDFKVLNVKHLNVEKINGKNIKSILQTKDLLGRGISITTEHLKVEGSLEADLINDIDVKQKFKSALMTDGVIKLNKVELKSISGDNINVRNLNNHSLDSSTKFSLRENPKVVVHGDVQVSNFSKVTSINDFPANFSKVVNKRRGATIYGKKKFSAQIVVSKELKLNTINNVNFESWFANLLRLSGNQDVTGFYTIRDAEMKSLYSASSINRINMSSFIYNDQPKVNLVSSIKFKSIAVDGDVNSASLHGSCYLPKVNDELVFEHCTEWSFVDIQGDSFWPKARGDRLQHFFESAVRSQSDQTITGNVTMQLLSAPNVQVQSLNGKNITSIFHDTLSRRKTNQVITGKKTFSKSFRCNNIEIEEDAKVNYINDININEFDEILVRVSGDEKETVHGHKTFLNGFQAFTLKCPRGINGVTAERIVTQTFAGNVPPLNVESLRVEGNIKAKTIDDLHIDRFLSNCIYLNNTEKQLIKGQLHIKGNVTLQGKATASSINEISTNDLIFMRNNKKSVKINGCKKFLSNIEIESDPHIDILNLRNLTKAYNENVKIDQDVTMNGSVTISSEVEVDTIYARMYSVGSKQLIYLNKTLSP